MADVTQVLSDQHREVESLFEQFTATASTESQQDIVRTIIETLSRHSAVEEMTVYPAIAEEVGQPAADSLLGEHQELKELLAEIEKLGVSDPAWEQKVLQARTAVQEHVAEEERDVFPRFRSEVSADTLDELGSKIESQWKAAPTHPHPNAPNTPPANKAAGPVAGALDRTRDAITGD
jgi:hemerythrin superfamily protein